jgi:tRNA pseudouridine38-40 synthase
MRRLKLTLEYDGTDFYGWQVQTKSAHRTVQGVMQAALTKLPGNHSSPKSAGRTDAGVHALAMVAHLDTTTSVPDKKIARALNAHLPQDVKVLTAERVSDDFDAQYDCCYRRYIYKMRLLRHDLRGVVLDQKYSLGLYQDLALESMQQAALLFEGSHDFASLATQETRQTVRRVYLCQLEHQGNQLNLHIAADGFLRGMVRAVVGTLLRVGEGSLQANDIPKILHSKQRSKAGKNVLPQGLFFVEASYEPWRVEDGVAGRIK